MRLEVFLFRLSCHRVLIEKGGPQHVSSCFFAPAVAVLLFASFFLAPATIHGTAAKHLLISEVLYDPASQEPGSEFVEIFNPLTDLPASVEGWALQDKLEQRSPATGYNRTRAVPVVTANQADFLAANPGFSGQLVAGP